MKKQKLKPRWHNMYLAIFYIIGYGSIFCLGLAFMGWFINGPELIYFGRIFCLIHILLWLAIYVLTELVELIYKRL